MLHYDERSPRFVGTRYVVTADAYFNALCTLCCLGLSIPKAIDHLCNERAWSLDVAGVEPIFTAEAVIDEAEAVLASVRRPPHEDRPRTAGV